MSETDRVSGEMAGRLAGPYRLIRHLGRGGMGSLWVGEDPASGQQVAVKLVRSRNRKEDPTALARFERETQVLAQIDHPHVAKLIAHGELENGAPFIAMDLLAGESLVDRLEGMEAPMPIGHVTELITQLGDTLAYIHGLDIIHRDLKAEHVMLVGPREGLDSKIIDFGLAKAPGVPQVGLALLTEPGTALGSAEYMSPEQFTDSAEVDAQADLWALAVLTYMASTQAFPFSGRTLSDVLGAIKSGQFVPPSTLNSSVPTAVDTFFERAFDLDVDERYASARDMVHAWYVATGLQQATRPSRTAPIALVVAVVFVVMTGIAVFFAMR